MLSIKRLLYIVTIVLVISTIFFIYNINEQKSKDIKIMRQEDESMMFMDSDGLSGNQETKYIIVGETQKEICKEIYKNVLNYVDDLKLSYKIVDYLDASNLNSDSVVIFCVDEVIPYANLKDLENFIENGGHVILAAGISEGNTESYLNTFLGITEKSTKENYNELKFVDSVFPLQYPEMVYSGYNQSTWITVKENAHIYIQDANKGVPILYTYDYGKGSTCLINGTFLADRNCCGLLTGAISSMTDYFIYPVLGVKAVFLDNFPAVTYVNDKLCMKMYGCTTESFVRDIIWTRFRGMALRTDVVYSSSMLVESSNKKSFSTINENLVAMLGKSVLQYNGELIYSANCKDSQSIYYNDPLLEKFNSIFSKYEVNGLALVNDTSFNETMLQVPNGEISAIRGRMDFDNPFEFNSDYFMFPGATFGNGMEDGNLFEISSVLAAYGMVSHCFNIDLLIAENKDVASWDRYKKQLSMFESKVLDKVSYLDAKTLSNTKNRVKSYDSLSYEWYQKEGSLYLNCKNVIPNQPFLMKSKSRIVDAHGLEYEDIGNGYYLMSLQKSKAIIELE